MIIQSVRTRMIKRQNGGGARAKRRGEKKIPEETGLTPPLEAGVSQRAECQP